MRFPQPCLQRETELQLMGNSFVCYLCSCTGVSVRKLDYNVNNYEMRTAKLSLTVTCLILQCSHWSPFSNAKPTTSENVYLNLSDDENGWVNHMHRHTHTHVLQRKNWSFTLIPTYYLTQKSLDLIAVCMKPENTFQSHEMTKCTGRENGHGEFVRRQTLIGGASRNGAHHKTNTDLWNETLPPPSFG